MKTTLLILALLIAGRCEGQNDSVTHRYGLYVYMGGASTTTPATDINSDTVYLEHKSYRSIFIKHLHIPYLVHYQLTAASIQCPTKIKRTNNFRADPLCADATDLKRDYVNSSYDKGHCFSAQSNACSEIGESECFYFSNMMMQKHSFNAGLWYKLEQLERQQCASDTLEVFVGSYGIIGYKGSDSVAVPDYMYKVIYSHSNKAFTAYTFQNKDGLTGTISDYQVPTDSITVHTKIMFNK